MSNFNPNDNGIKVGKIFTVDGQKNPIVKYGIQFRIDKDTWVFLKEDNLLESKVEFDTYEEASEEARRVRQKLNNTSFKGNITKK